MTVFARTDTSIMGRWWWTVDRWTIAALALIAAAGAILTLAASPPIADRLALDPFYFARRQFAYLPAALILLFGVSLLSPRGIRRLAVIGFGVSILLLAATFFVGAEIKGARRWVDLGFISMQPSEFVKPTMAVLTGWAFAAHRAQGLTQANAAALALLAAVVGMLVLQPDIGMAVIVSATWLAQLFLAGLGLHWVALAAVVAAVAMIVAYSMLPHVAARIDRFIDPTSGDSYQIDRSLEAFANGGLLGRGPGEGTIKAILPDAHSDFVFAVAGEEFGLIACLFVVGLFAFVALRAVAQLLREDDLFVLLAGVGLVTQFAMQAAVNMGSALRLIPTKGMTLPFISYGGSSLLAVALGVGMLLALTRRRVRLEWS